MHDVVVIGGGIAGLAAATELRARGADVVIVEGRPRLGGRIHTRRDDAWPAPFEEGAEFVHGRDPELMAALRRAGLHAERGGDRRWLRRDGQLGDGSAAWKQGLPLLYEEPGLPGDRSVGARIAEARVDEVAREFVRGYVEGFHGAPPPLASARAISEQQRAADRIHGDESRRVREGYGALIAHLAAGLDPRAIRLGAAVEAVAWRRHAVTVRLRSSLGWPLPPVSARQALVTLPLGVLQDRPGAASVRFAPSLPLDKRRAIKALAVADVVKVLLAFREPFWQAHEQRLGELAFVHAAGAAVPTWWQPLPFREPMLVGWAAGPTATRLGRRGPVAIARRAVGAIAEIMDVPVDTVAALLSAWHVVDWRDDRFACGAYSWVPVGALRAQAVLAAPVADTLFFAGEATHTEGASGTVHGALATGLRAAGELASKLRAPPRAPRPA